MAFTENQLKAIELRNRNILVSAAAGSGKTSVLVERIIRRITSDNPTIDIDRLLIMTFTKAAAKEMRDRIRQAIEAKLEEDPNNDRLIRQSVLIHNAMITTIHGFCQSIIRDHFEEVSIDPTFRVADDNECKLLEQDALEYVLEEYYAEGDKDFLDTVECFAGGKGDDAFAELILKIYHFSQSNPDPKAYLDSLYIPYDVNDEKTFESLDFVKAYIDDAVKSARETLNIIAECLQTIDLNPGLSPYKKAFESDYDQIEKLTEARTFDEFHNLLSAITYKSFAGIKDEKISESEVVLKSEVSEARSAYKDKLNELKAVFAFSLAETCSNMKNCKPYVNMIGRLVNDFALQFSAMKREKNIIDFNDMEHMAIKILSENQAVADSYREQFEEIYVDEYQDSNMTQETLINCVKRVSPNGNLFMVGDVKQSIYRFRQARSALFVEKYDSYQIDDGANQKVLLNDNFRSRREVLDAVNEIFAVIMKKEVGGIEYDEDASLRCGASYYDVADKEYYNNNPEALLDKDYKAELVMCVKGELPKAELEAEYIAGRIGQMISQQMPVLDKSTNSIRPVTYKDIVILTRSIRTVAPVLKAVLENNGIPVSVTSNTGFFNSLEVQTALAFLSVVDNPIQDIKLATYIKCPVWDFEDSELAMLRKKVNPSAEKKNVSLYESLKLCSESEGQDIYSQDLIDKCKAVIDKINYYRHKAAFVPVYGILNEFIDKEYGDYVRCMDRGEQRMANLKALVVKAEEYSNTSFKGLFNFVRYMALIQKYEIEDGETNIQGEEDNVVRIMTIHKSKGLEFPVCFVFGVEKKRNTGDESGNVIWDADNGIGVECINLDKRVKTETVYKRYIKNCLKTENIAEEMRVLYVAMTRAREKLIMVGFVDKVETFENAKTSVLAVSSYQDMIAIANKAENGLKHLDIIFCTEEDIVKQRMGEEIGREAIREEFLEITREDCGNQELSDKLSGIELIYPGKAKYQIPSKLSVSELKHTDIERKMAEGSEVVEEGQRLFEGTNPDKYIPNFMLEEGQTKSGATFYGTAFHRILELWDYSIEEVSPENITEYVDRMLQKNMLSIEQAEAINAKDIAFFLNTELGRRIYAAKKNGLLFREQPFMIGCPAEEVAGYLGLTEGENVPDSQEEQETSEELVIIQGIIDAYIIEDDEITIIDYKTDSVSDPKILLNRYTSQLEYYRKALEQITEKKVKELVIYSSKLRKEIKF